MPITGTHRLRFVGAWEEPDPLKRYRCLHCGERFAEHSASHELCTDAPEPWSSWRINERFLSGLLESFGDREITNREAYKYYWQHHSEQYKTLAGALRGWRDPFLQMNVRNTLCKAAHIGRLVRIAPGRYRFP